MLPRIFVLLLFCSLATACQESSIDKAKADAIQAGAEATRAATEYQNQQRAIELGIRATTAAVEVQGRIEKLDAEAKTETAKGEASARAITAAGWGAMFALFSLGIGSGIAVIVLATGKSVAHVRQVWIASEMIKIGVEASTLLPPPFVITRDGFMLDTRTGERARLRDSVGVNQMRLAATTQSTNIALLARAAERIGETNKSKGGGTQAADVLPGIGTSVPLLDVVDAKR